MEQEDVKKLGLAVSHIVKAKNNIMPLLKKWERRNEKEKNNTFISTQKYISYHHELCDLRCVCLDLTNALATTYLFDGVAEEVEDDLEIKE